MIFGGSFAGGGNFGGATFEGHDVDAWLAKWSGAGEHLWSKSFGGAGEDVIGPVHSGPTNDIVITGYFTNEIDLGEGNRLGSGGTDAFIAKYAPDGTLRWSRDFGGPAWDKGGGVQIDALGAVYAVGWFEAPLDLGRGPTTTSGVYLMELAP